MAKAGRDFHLYKLQFREEATLFPTSSGIDDPAAFIYDVLKQSMQIKTKKPRRWVVAELRVDYSFGSTILFGQLVRLKKRRTIHFYEDGLKLDTEVIDDADTSAFVMESTQEYFLLQASTQIADETAIARFKDFFNGVDMVTRKNRLMYFEPINPNERAIERLKQHRIRKFTAILNSPNGEINKAFENLFGPVSKNTQADKIAVTWESESGRLNVEDSAIDEALTWSAEYGSWKAIPLEKGASPILSEDTPLATTLEPTDPQGIIAAARTFFREVRERLGGLHQ